MGVNESSSVRDRGDVGLGGVCSTGMRASLVAINNDGRVMTTGSGSDPIGSSAADLDDVYKTEIRRLIGLGAVLMGSRSAGEDLAHDAFLLVLRRPQRDPAYLRSPAWPLLRTVLVRLSVQRRRSIAREGRRLARFWEPAVTESWDPDLDLIDWQAMLSTLPCHECERAWCSSTERT